MAVLGASGKKAVLHGDWKLVGSGDPANWELYDLESDRSELRNLAENEPESGEVDGAGMVGLGGADERMRKSG